MRGPGAWIAFLLVLPTGLLMGLVATLLVTPSSGVAEHYQTIGRAFLLAGLLVGAIGAWALRDAIGEDVPARAIYMVAIGAGLLIAFMDWATVRQTARSPIHDERLVSVGVAGAAGAIACAGVLAVWLAVRVTPPVRKPTLCLLASTALTLAIPLAFAGLYSLGAAESIAREAAARPSSQTLYYRTPAPGWLAVTLGVVAAAWVRARVSRNGRDHQ